MADRVSPQMLERKITDLNLLVGADTEAYGRRGPGLELRANVGTYVLSQQYGGVGLERIISVGGGVHTVYHTMPKRALYDLITAFIDGIHIGITLDQSKEALAQAPN